MNDDIGDWEISYPQRTFWFLQVPTSTDRAEVWKSFVTNVLGLKPVLARTDSTAKQTVKEWCLEFEMLESDLSMTEERLFT